MSNKYNDPYFIFRMYELCFGTVCFGLFAYYYIAVETFNDSSQLAIVKYGICFVAADAFPFIVQIPYLIAYLYHGKSFQHNILNPITSLIGAIVYLTSGSLNLSALSDFYNLSTAYAALGGFLIATGALYLSDLVFWMIKYRKNPQSLMTIG